MSRVPTIPYQEYFEKYKNRHFPKAHETITRTCITYLSFTVFNEVAFRTRDALDRQKGYTLHEYAASQWGYHAQLCDTRDVALTDSILDFLENDNFISAATEAMIAHHPKRPKSSSTCYDFNPQGLHLAAYFGLLDVARAILDSGRSVNVTDREGATPLHWATVNNQPAMMRFLLENRANVNARKLKLWADRSWMSMANLATPIMLAVDNTLLEACEILLDYHTVVSYETLRSAYHAQNERPHALKGMCSAVLKLLLPMNDDARNDLLILAAVFNDLSLIKDILDIGASELAMSRSLDQASSQGSVESVKMLLLAGANAKIDAFKGINALWSTIYGYGDDARRTVILKLLLHAGTQIELCNPKEKTVIFSLLEQSNTPEQHDITVASSSNLANRSVTEADSVQTVEESKSPSEDIVETHDDNINDSSTYTEILVGVVPTVTPLPEPENDKSDWPLSLAKGVDSLDKMLEGDLTSQPFFQLSEPENSERYIYSDRDTSSTPAIKEPLRFERRRLNSRKRSI